MKPSPIPFRFNYDEHRQLWILTTGNLFGRKQYVGKSIIKVRALYKRVRQHQRAKIGAEFVTTNITPLPPPPPSQRGTTP